MDVIRIVMNIALALLLTATGSGKLIGTSSSHEVRDSLGVPAPAWRVIGAFEVLLVIGLIIGVWLHPLGLIATIGVIVLMIGAITTRFRAGGRQRNAGVTADAVLLLVAAITTAIAV